MGFNKKFLDKDFIIKSLNSGKTLNKIFNADAFIFLDNVSSKIYEMYCEKLDESEIFKFLNNNQV